MSKAYPEFVYNAWCWCAGEASVVEGRRQRFGFGLMDILSPFWWWVQA